jgi:hypothetical protein
MAFRRLALHDSSSIAAASYDPAQRILRITFKPAGPWDRSRTYDYSEVPQVLADDLTGAESHGQFVNYRIKPHFSCQEVP